MRRTIGIDTKLAEELKNFALNKHGFLHGTLKAEIEAAIRAHITTKKEATI
jgi:hypothetical protein